MDDLFMTGNRLKRIRYLASYQCVILIAFVLFPSWPIYAQEKNENSSFVLEDPKLHELTSSSIETDIFAECLLKHIGKATSAKTAEYIRETCSYRAQRNERHYQERLNDMQATIEDKNSRIISLKGKARSLESKAEDLNQKIQSLKKVPEDWQSEKIQMERTIRWHKNVLSPIFKVVQKTLKSEGYYKGPIDGKWDTEVALAMEELQENKGLQVDGYPDAKSLKATGIDF